MRGNADFTFTCVSSFARSFFSHVPRMAQRISSTSRLSTTPASPIGQLGGGGGKTTRSCFSYRVRVSPTLPFANILHLENTCALYLPPLAPSSRFALDLVEVYFEICHTRFALLAPSQFRAQLLASLPPVSRSQPPPGSPHVSLPASSTSATRLSPQSLHHAHSQQLHTHQQQTQQSLDQSTVHPAVLAAVLAWGAKFSEHPLILLDRSADRMQRSRLAKSLIRKAWEVAEAEKMHTIPSADAVVVSLLLDGLHSRMYISLKLVM
jgi:hypothetical protein